jgi:yeast amino acid transporter
MDILTHCATCSGFDAFLPSFHVDKLILKYIGTVLFLGNIALWKIWKKTRRVKAGEVDMVTGRREFEEMESAADAEWKQSTFKSLLARIKASR